MQTKGVLFIKMIIFSLFLLLILWMKYDSAHVIVRVNQLQ